MNRYFLQDITVVFYMEHIFVKLYVCNVLRCLVVFTTVAIPGNANTLTSTVMVMPTHVTFTGMVMQTHMTFMVMPTHMTYSNDNANTRDFYSNGNANTRDFYSITGYHNASHIQRMYVLPRPART